MTLNPIEAGDMNVYTVSVEASTHLRNTYALAAISDTPSKSQAVMMRMKRLKLLQEGWSEKEAHAILMGYPHGWSISAQQENHIAKFLSSPN